MNYNSIELLRAPAFDQAGPDLPSSNHRFVEISLAIVHSKISCITIHYHFAF